MGLAGGACASGIGARRGSVSRVGRKRESSGSVRQSRLREQRTGRRRQVSKVRLEHASEAWEAQRCQPRRRHRRLHGGQGTQEVAGPTAMPHVSHGQVANPYGGVTLCSVEMPGGFCPAAFQTRVSRQLRSMRSWAHGAAPGTVAERGIWSPRSVTVTGSFADSSSGC